MHQVNQLAAALQAIFTDVADRLARELGVVRRRRVFTGSSLVQALVFGWLGRPDASPGRLAEMAARCGAPVTPQAIRGRFTPALNRLLERLIDLAAAQVVTADPRAADLLARFPCVSIQDSTVVSLPEAHRHRWPGCGGNAPAAALKVQVRWDLLRGTLSGLALEPGRRPDHSTTLGTGDLPAGSIRIADLGYFRISALSEIAAGGSYFLSRIQVGTAISGPDGRRIDLWGDLGRCRGSLVEMAVRIGTDRPLACRLIAWRCPDGVARRRREKIKLGATRRGRPAGDRQLLACRWSVLVTNAPARVLAAGEAWTLYRARWQVELMFKLWKSGNRLSRPNPGDPERVLAEVYAKLLGAMVQHWTSLTCGWAEPDRSLAKAAGWIRDRAADLAKIVSRGHWDRLADLIEDLRSELSKTARVGRRKKSPSTFQTLGCPGCPVVLVT